MSCTSGEWGNGKLRHNNDKGIRKLNTTHYKITLFKLKHAWKIIKI